MIDKKFTLYWLTGDREVVEGATPAAAMTAAGYGQGALRALDFYAAGESTEWVWHQDTRSWLPHPDSEFGKEIAALKAKQSPLT